MRGLNRLSGHEPSPRTSPVPDSGWDPRTPGAPAFMGQLGYDPRAAHHAQPGHDPRAAHHALPDRMPPEAATARAPKAPGAFDRPVNTRLLYVWALLFGFVGTQLAWTLRPFIGEPNLEFQLFRDIEGSFYSNVLSTIASFF